MNIIPRPVIPKTVSMREPILKIFPLIGYAPFAEHPKKTLKNPETNKS